MPLRGSITVAARCCPLYFQNQHRAAGVSQRRYQGFCNKLLVRLVLTMTLSLSRLLIPASFVLSSTACAQVAEKPKLAEETFKNIRVLKGITSNEFMATMSFFSAALGANCNYCHIEESGGDWSKYADDSVKQKATARMMVGMVANMNKMYFGGRRVLTCYSCHRGTERPKVIPNLDDLYGPPVLETSDDFLEQSPKTMTADQILTKHIQAIGGDTAASRVTSYIGKGTYEGYDTKKAPYEVYAKSPNLRATIQHTPNGDSITAFDGKSGWASGPATDRPVTLTPIVGGELDAARVDGDVGFPSRIRQAFTEWKVGFPTSIDDRDVLVLQGSGGGHVPTRFYFDKMTGLLMRMVRYTDSVVGLNPTRYDFADYRDVGGVKMPYKWGLTWLGGRATIELSEIQANVAIDSAKFAKPAER